MDLWVVGTLAAGWAAVAFVRNAVRANRLINQLIAGFNPERSGDRAA